MPEYKGLNENKYRNVRNTRNHESASFQTCVIIDSKKNFFLTLHEQLEPQKQFVNSENWSPRKLVWSEMISETKTSYCFYTENTNFCNKLQRLQ